MDGLCGPSDFGGHGDFHGGHGVMSIAFGATDSAAIDFIGGADNKAVDTDPCGFLDPRKMKAEADKDGYGVRGLMHGEFNMFALMTGLAEKAGLVKLPQILTGQKTLDLDWTDGILPTTAWAGINNGPMPFGFTEESHGKTRAFRQFYHVGQKDWPWSSPVVNRELVGNLHLDIAGMTWFDAEFGDFESQLFVRVVASKILDRAFKPLVAHRQVARSMVCSVAETLRRYKPSAESVRLRSAQAGGAVPTDVETVQAVAASGPDLHTALTQPARRTAGGIAAFTLPPLREAVDESVTVTVTLPPRRRTA